MKIEYKDLAIALQEQINTLKERITYEQLQNKLLNDSDSAKTIATYNESYIELTDEQKQLDDLCYSYFEAMTELADIICENQLLCDGLTGDKYSDEVDNNDVEEVELISDKEIIEIAEKEENV